MQLNKQKKNQSLKINLIFYFQKPTNKVPTLILIQSEKGKSHTLTFRKWSDSPADQTQSLEHRYQTRSFCSQSHLASHKTPNISLSRLTGVNDAALQLQSTFYRVKMLCPIIELLLSDSTQPRVSLLHESFLHIPSRAQI